ncbi:MAG: PEP/pyruvate-binding domain-containing protein [Planctomycetota bacterium]
MRAARRAGEVGFPRPAFARRAGRGGPGASLHGGWVIANHILVSFHVAFISSVLALPAEVATRADVLRFVFASGETLVSAAFAYLSFHLGIALHELGHFRVAARLRVLADDVLAAVEPRLCAPLGRRLSFLVRQLALAPYGRAPGIKREGLNYYPDAPYNLAVAAAGPRASRSVALVALPPAVLLLAAGLLAAAPPAVYAGRFLLGLGVVGLLDFLLADPGKYREFQRREKAARQAAASVGELSGWYRMAPAVKERLARQRMQEATHPRLGRVSAPWQFRNCGMGGRHTEKEYPESNISMQEAMFVILGARDSQESQEMTVRLQNRLKEIIEKESGCRVMGIGLEGGLAPYVDRAGYPLPEVRLWAMMKQAIEECGYAPGADVAIALDPAMSELEIAYRQEFAVPDAVGTYLFWRDHAKTVLDRDGVLAIYERALREFEIPIVSIEDAFSETDHEGWKMLLERLGDRILVIGDDLVTTNDRTIEEAASRGLINAVLVKANQIGTLYETLLAVLTTLGKGLEVVVSHRSKSPNDDMEAHIALAVNALGLKAGGGANTERLVKYHAVTMQMADVESANLRDALPEFHRAIVSRITAYEEPTNAGIPTVGTEVELHLPEAALRIAFKGATPLGTSAGTGEAVHLVDRHTEYFEHREVIDGHRDLFEEVETGVFRFARSATAGRVRERKDSGLDALYEKSHRYDGKGCQNAVANVREIIAPFFTDRNVAALGPLDIDRALLELELETARRRGKIDDAAPPEAAIRIMQRKQNLGMNALLSTSLALARGVAHVQGKRLYEFLREEMLAIIERLAAEHDVAIAGGRFEDSIAALREVERRLAAAGRSLHGELRRISGIYERLDREAAVLEPVPVRPRHRPAAAVPAAAPAAVEVAAAEAAAPAAPVEAPAAAGEAVADLDAPLIRDLSRTLAVALAAEGAPARRRDALWRYLSVQREVGRRTGRFEIVNDRVYRHDGGLYVPYSVGDRFVLHDVRGGNVAEVCAQRFPAGTILTDELILGAAGRTGTPLDLESEEFETADSAATRIDRVRDMAAILARMNNSGNLKEVIYHLRFVVAKLCSISFKGFMGAKNLQPEVRRLSTEVSHLLNGPFAPRLRLPLRILVRNISGLVLRPKVIDELWNDTIDLSEVHVRGSALTNELRRSAHHALGAGTLRLARAYLTYLRTGDGSALPEPGPAALSEADEEARSKKTPPEIVARVVANLEELLGTSQVVTRIREWQEAYTGSLLRCESGNRAGDEGELLVSQGIRAANHWAYRRHLRILRQASEAGAWASGAGAKLRGRLDRLEEMGPDRPDFDADRTAHAARRAVEEFVAELIEKHQEDLFRSIEGVLAAYGQDSFAESFFQISRFRTVVDHWLQRGDFPEQRHLLLQLDCLLEEMGFLCLRRVSSQYEEEGVHLRRCLGILAQCVGNLEHDGLYSRELIELAAMLGDENKTRAEILDVLEGVQHTYHRLFQRFSVAYQKMAGQLGLDEDELRAVLANYQRYLHDLNSMVHFADLAKGHIEHSGKSLSLRVDGEPAAPTAPEGAFDFLHLSHRDRIDRLLADAEPSVSLQDAYGGKGCSLIYISHLHIPTRDGFIIPTTLPRAGIHLSDQSRLRRELKKHLRVLEQDIEAAGEGTRRFATPEHPLLLAVRGGSVFTMPGMLTTIVFVGMNDEVASALARDDPWYAHDAYRRFLATYADAVWGLNLEEFDLVEDTKRRYGVTFKEELPGQAMQEVAEASKAVIRRKGFGDELERILEDPFLQLVGAVNAVYESWNSRRALQYREVTGLAHDWHTAVIVQQMASGNHSNEAIRRGMAEERASLTGVIPRTEMNSRGFRTYTGDIKFSACGDDLVGGLTSADSLRPVQDLQALMPTLARELLKTVARLRRYRGTDPEIEFTVERGKLSVLQARMAQTASVESVRAFLDPGEEEARGIGIRGGAFRGIVAFDEDDLAAARARRAAGPDEADGVLLVLENPTPHEIPMILSADGLVTAKGGSTSHAAVAIHSIEARPYAAVLSVRGLRVNARTHAAVLVDPQGRTKHRIAPGDVLSIHGQTGALYVGPRALL